MPTTTVKGVYVLFGQDAFLRDAHRAEIIRLAIGEADPQTCLADFDADAALADVLDELRTLPFLAPRRVVIVRNADDFIKRHRGAIEDYLNTPSATATLILSVASWPKTTRLYKLVAKVGQAIDCNVPRRGVASWLNRSAAKRDKKIAPQAARQLAEWMGHDLALLDMEMEKLSLFIGERETITPEDVSAVVTATAGPQQFALSNALIAGDASAALKAADGMVTSPGEEFRILGLIAFHLRRVLHGHQLAAAGKDPAGAISPRTPHSAKNAFAAMLNRRPMGVVQNDFRKLIRADLGMKSGVKASSALRDLIVGLCTT